MRAEHYTNQLPFYLNSNKYYFTKAQNQFENFDSKANKIEIYFETENGLNILAVSKNLTPNSFESYTIKNSITVSDFLSSYDLIPKINGCDMYTKILFSDEILDSLKFANKIHATLNNSPKTYSLLPKPKGNTKKFHW